MIKLQTGETTVWMWLIKEDYSKARPGELLSFDPYLSFDRIIILNTISLYFIKTNVLMKRIRICLSIFFQISYIDAG